MLGAATVPVIVKLAELTALSADELEYAIVRTVSLQLTWNGPPRRSSSGSAGRRAARVTCPRMPQTFAGTWSPPRNDLSAEDADDRGAITREES